MKSFKLLGLWLSIVPIVATQVVKIQSNAQAYSYFSANMTTEPKLALKMTETVFLKSNNSSYRLLSSTPKKENNDLDHMLQYPMKPLKESPKPEILEPEILEPEIPDPRTFETGFPEIEDPKSNIIKPKILTPTVAPKPAS